MDLKEKYYKALIDNNGQLNEVDLGHSLGLDEEETMKLISQLLQEYKLKYVNHYNCNYRSTRKK